MIIVPIYIECQLQDVNRSNTDSDVGINMVQLTNFDNNNF